MAKIVSTSILTLAKTVGMSPSTVSLALRGSPLVKAETAEKIRTTARKLGYRPDVRVASLMARIRSSTTRPSSRETLAFVWVNTSIAATKQDYFFKTIWEGAKRRAEGLGCELTPFWLDEEGMTPVRLQRILRARGITGVIFSTPSQIMEVRLDWNWSAFAVAVIGHTEWQPNFHRAGHHHYRSMWTTIERLRHEGKKRPAAILHTPHHQRIHGVHWAAFVANHPQPQLAQAMSRFDLPAEVEELRPWFREIRADALILVVHQPADVIARLQQVSQIDRIVTLECRGIVPGVDQRLDTLAAGAIDLVVGQLHRNERGIPPAAATLEFEGEWRELG